MDSRGFDGDLEITGSYSPLMVPQNSPNSRQQPLSRYPSPFIMNGETFDLTADDEQPASVVAPVTINTNVRAASPIKAVKVPISINHTY